MKTKIEVGTRVRLNWRGARVADAGDEGVVRQAPDKAGAFEVRFPGGRLVCDESMVTVLGPPEPPPVVPDELKELLRGYTGVEDDTDAGITCRDLVELCVRCWELGQAAVALAPLAPLVVKGPFPIPEGYTPRQGRFHDVDCRCEVCVVMGKGAQR